MPHRSDERRSLLNLYSEDGAVAAFVSPTIIPEIADEILADSFRCIAAPVSGFVSWAASVTSDQKGPEVRLHSRFALFAGVFALNVTIPGG